MHVIRHDHCAEYNGEFGTYSAPKLGMVCTSAKYGSGMASDGEQFDKRHIDSKSKRRAQFLRMIPFPGLPESWATLRRESEK
jgi:hypothetical protein